MYFTLGPVFPASRSSGRLQALLTHPRFAIAAVMAAIAIALPTIGLGFYSDDYVLLGRIRGRLPGPHGPFDLYRLTPPSGASVREMYPWWSAEKLEIDFSRPLSSALLWLDHAVFQLRPLGYHLHSIAWYAATVAAVVFVHRRALPGVTGALAALAFLLDDSHVQPVAWIACRHALVSAAPALFGLGAYLRYRSGGQRTWLWLTLIGLGIGLGGGESALGVVAYLMAYELVGRTDAARDRLRALSPILALTVAYLALYSARGHGAAGNDFYFAPTSDPAGFLGVLILRAPILIADAILGAPTDLANLVTPPHSSCSASAPSLSSTRCTARFERSSPFTSGAPWPGCCSVPSDRSSWPREPIRARACSWCRASARPARSPS